MNTKLVLAIVSLLTVQLFVTAQQPTTQNPYEVLLERVKKQDKTVNFTDLRMAYTDTKLYHPYGGDTENRKAMFAALNAKEYEKVLTASDQMLSSNYLDMNAHFGAFVAHRELGHAEKAGYHKYVFQNLIDSVDKSGDGKSTKTAFVVISTDEEYVWFNYMGLRVSGQALVNETGHNYDRMTATNPKTGETVTVFFNIDKPFNWLGNSLKSKP